MAGDAIVGALRIVLGMDTGTLEDDTKKAASQLQNFGKAVSAVAGGIALEKAVEKLVHSFKELIVGAIDAADSLGKMAQKVGIPVDELSKLKLAADLSDVSMESLSTSLGKLSKSLVEAKAGSQEQKKQFDALGVSVTNADGTIRSVSDVLADISDKFSKSTDGATKTATALALLGRGGKDLIPLLNQGSEEMRHLADVAEHMGLVISKDTSAQAEKFNDNLKILHAATTGLANTIAAALLPALVNISKQFVDSAESGETMRFVAEKIVNAIKSIVVIGAQTVTVLTTLGEALKLLDEVTSTQPKDWQEFKERMQAVADSGSDLSDRLIRTREAVMGLFTAISVGSKTLHDMEGVTSKVSQTIQDFQFKTQVLNQDFIKLAPGFAEAAHGLKLFGENGIESRTTVEALSPELQKLNAAMLAFRAAQITQDNLLPLDAFAQKMTALNVVMDSGKLSAQAYQQEVIKLGVQLRNTYAQAAESIVGPLAQALATAATMNKQFAGAAKAAAIADATIKAYQAANLALASVPPPFNIAAAAAAVALGLANVAKITATNFATGGSFTVGGAGGIDSQLVAFNASPGEMVDVRKPGQSGGTVSEITVNMRGRDLISKDMVRDLFTALNEGTRDGYRLKLA